MIVTIVGAGNAGSGNAFVAAENGHEVRILKTSRGVSHDAHFEAMRKNGGLWGIDNTRSAKYSDFDHESERTFQPLALVTRDVEEAILGADVIMVFVLVEFHETLARRLAPYLRENQLLILAPGYMGSVYFHRHCAERPLLSEAESNAHDAFVHEPGCVKVIFRNVRNCLSYLPAEATDRGQAIASELFETYRDTRENIVATALHNPNLTVHTVGMYAMKPMMDYCAKYHPDEVPGMYRDALDEEDLSKDAREVFEAYKVVTPGGPDTFHHRYITEDVPYGLVLMSSLGRAMGVPMPTCDHVVQVVGAVMGRDYFSEGRTLERLGIEHLGREELLAFLERG